MSQNFNKVIREAEYRILGTVSDKRNLDRTVTLDHIPEGCDYDPVLYDGDGKVEVEGIEDTAVKEKAENILSGFSGERMNSYISINASMQGMAKQEQYILKAAMGIEAFLQKATGGDSLFD